ncbi:MAG: YicC/YloC family endoribonuclease [Pseudomonadota bacterium]
MTKSMTGYARCETTTEGVSLTWELRTVNHRFLDVSFRLPEEFRLLETKFRERIGACLSRGKIDCGLRVRSDRVVAPDLVLNQDLADKVIAVTGALSKAMANPAQVDPIHIMRWPGVVSEAERDWAPIHESALSLLDETLSDLGAGRLREGQRLEAMLDQRCDDIVSIVAQVGARLPEVREQIRHKTLNRVQQLVAEPDMDRIEQELVLIAQKMDVAEELDRLNSHVAEAKDVLKRDEPIGRRLDFLMQEFNREANTLASKSQDAQCTKLAVELKVLIEQMREQVQNIE